MMKYLSILLLCLISMSIFSSTEEEVARRKELAAVIEEELQEVVRLNKQTKGQRPELLLRMSELLLERGRLVKEDEVDAYMRVGSKERSAINKAQFFRNSTSYFTKADQLCLLIVKRYPSFKFMADVYYVLAFNAKEFNRNDVAKRYFKKVMSTTTVKDKSYQRSALALAEIYFNVEAGQVQKAIDYYESLGGDLSKNLINLGKLLSDKANYKMAENLIERALKKSDNVINQKNGLFALSNLYEKTLNLEKQLEVQRKLVALNKEGELDKSEQELLKYSLEKNSAVLQQQVIKGEYSHRPQERVRRANLAVEFFKLNGVFAPEKKHLQTFNAAETLFAVGRYRDSLAY